MPSTHSATIASARVVPVGKATAECGTPQRLLGNDRYSHQISPSVVSPNSRCRVTIRGFSSRVTVSIPRMACRTTMPNSANAYPGGTMRDSRVAIANPAMAMMISTNVPAA